MASRSSVEGIMPASLSFVAFTRTITRIGLSPRIYGGRTGLPAHTTNEHRRDRHRERKILREQRPDRGGTEAHAPSAMLRLRSCQL
jgi:hypothetical protein